MKKLLLSLFLTTALSVSSFASHIVGGVINVSIDSNDVATFDLYIYRDASGIFLNATSFPITVTGPLSNSYTVNASFVTMDTLTDTPFVMERYLFSGTLSLTNSGLYTAEATTPCCRSIVVLNANPGVGTVLQTSFTHNMGLSSNSPVFLGNPIGKFPKDTVWNYNPMPFDADGDSLYWSLGGNGYLPGYTLPPSNPGGALSIDPQSGVLSWSASQIGVYLVGIFVSEYDNGTFLGETYHEVQVIVVSDTSQLRIAPPVHVTAGPSGPTVNFMANSSNDISIGLASGHTNANLSIEIFGDPFMISNTNASFSVSKFKSQDSLVGTFSWSPDASLSGEGPYRLNFRLKDGSFTYDYTVLININGVFSVRENSTSQFTIYPNPSTGNFHIQPDILSDWSNLEMKIYDNSGKNVFNTFFDDNNGSRELKVNTSLPKGIYIVQLKNDKQVQSNRVVIE